MAMSKKWHISGAQRPPIPVAVNTVYPGRWAQNEAHYLHIIEPATSIAFCDPPGRQPKRSQHRKAESFTSITYVYIYIYTYVYTHMYIHAYIYIYI